MDESVRMVSAAFAFCVIVRVSDKRSKVKESARLQRGIRRNLTEQPSKMKKAKMTGSVCARKNPETPMTIRVVNGNSAPRLSNVSASVGMRRTSIKYPTIITTVMTMDG